MENHYLYSLTAFNQRKCEADPSWHLEDLEYLDMVSSSSKLGICEHIVKLDVTGIPIDYSSHVRLDS